MKPWIVNIKRAILLLKSIKLNPRIYELWDINEDFILDSTPKYKNDEHVGRFAYNPKTGELVIGTMTNQHAIEIAWQASSPFDEFVRGVYTGDSVMLRWYSTNPYASSDEIKAESYDAFYDTQIMLKRNGLPPNVIVNFGVSTEDIRQDVGRFYR